MTEPCSLSTLLGMTPLFGKSFSVLLMVMPLPQVLSMFPSPFMVGINHLVNCYMADLNWRLPFLID